MTPQDAPPTPPQEPPAPPPPRRLTRPSRDRMVAGVAAALGRHLGLDPALARVAFVVLALFGGSGIVLYAVLWLLLPSESGPAPIGPEASTGRRAALAGLILLAVLALPFAGPAFFVTAPALVVLAVLGALGVLLWRAFGGHGHPALVRAAWLVLAAAGTAVLAGGAAVAAALGGGTVVAAAVVALGVAMVVGGFLGGARWLAVPGLAMALALALVTAAGIDLTGGLGEREHRPASVLDLDEAYRLGMGELKLDLRDVDLPGGRTDLDLHVGMGNVELVVPEDVCVQLDGRVGAGKLRAFEDVSDGLDVRVRRRPQPLAGAPVLAVRAKAGFGRIDVDHLGAVAGQPACRA